MEKNDTAVKAFAIVNFIFCGLFLFGIVFLILALFYGVFFSGDSRDEILSGILGLAVILIPFLFGALAFGLSGIGLIKAKPWGYYLHIASAVLAAFSCVGIIYTVIAFVFVFRKDFRSVFFICEKGRCEHLAE